MSHRRPHRRASRPVSIPWVVAGVLAASTTLSASGSNTREQPSSLRFGHWPGRELDRFSSLDIFRGATTAAVVDAATAALPHVMEARAQPAPSLRYDIPPGPLVQVVKEFERLTGIAVNVAESSLLSLPSPGVISMRSSDEALAELLSNTGVAYRFTSPTTVVLELASVTETVDVRGGAPALSMSKLNGPLRDIPQTLTVITNEVIREQGATTLRDVLRNVPGITMQAGEGGGGLPGDNLTMRGFSATNDIFVDGIRDVGPYSRDAFNLEQVEVVKGPAGAVTGRGSAGGMINLSTKTANVTPDYRMQMSAGSAEFRRGTADLNQPLPALGAGAAFRVNAMWQESGVAGRDVVRNDSWAVAPTLTLGLTKPTRAFISYQHLQQDNVPDYGLPWAAFEATPAVDQSSFYGLRDYDFEDIDSDIATARLEHDVTRTFTLRNVTRYGDSVRESAITAPRPPNRQLQQRWMDTTAIGNLSSANASLVTGPLSHALTGGIEVLSERTRNRNSAQSTNQPQTTRANPNPNDRPFGPLPSNTGNPSEAVTTTVGAYLFDTVTFGARWQLGGGVRVDRSAVDYSLVNLTAGTSLDLERSDNIVTGRAGVVFKPRVNGSIYGGYGTSANPSADAAASGTALSDLPTAANNINLAPERTRNIELGTKWDVFNNRLALTGSVFRTEKTNARTRNATNDPFVLGGTQRVDGIEVGASGTLNQDWSVFAGYAYMNSEVTASANAAEQSANLALVPRSSFSAWTTYQLPGSVSIGGGAQFQDNVFRNSINTLSVPSYWLVSAVASYAVNSNLTLRVNGNNLTDTRYVDRVGGGHYIPGPRRALIVSTDVRF